jgi:nitrogen fixation protein FixH
MPSSVTSIPRRSFIPHIIIGVFVLFAIYIGIMVQQAMRTDVQLVSADYYQQELDFQERMQATARATALPVRIFSDETTYRITIQLPAAIAAHVTTGSVQFVRPSDAKLDFSVPFKPDANGQQLFSAAQLAPGYWQLRVLFSASNQSYFAEINLHKGRD